MEELKINFGGEKTLLTIAQYREALKEKEKMVLLWCDQI